MEIRKMNEFGIDCSSAFSTNSSTTSCGARSNKVVEKISHLVGWELMLQRD